MGAAAALCCSEENKQRSALDSENDGVSRMDSPEQANKKRDSKSLPRNRRKKKKSQPSGNYPNLKPLPNHATVSGLMAGPRKSLSYDRPAMMSDNDGTDESINMDQNFAQPQPGAMFKQDSLNPDYEDVHLTKKMASRIQHSSSTGKHENMQSLPRASIREITRRALLSAPQDGAHPDSSGVDESGYISGSPFPAMDNMDPNAGKFTPQFANIEKDVWEKAISTGNVENVVSPGAWNNGQQDNVFTFPTHSSWVRKKKSSFPGKGDYYKVFMRVTNSMLIWDYKTFPEKNEYTAEDFKKFKGHLNLKDVRMVRAIDSKNDKHEKDRKFQITMSPGTDISKKSGKLKQYVFKSYGERSRAAWVTILQQYIDHFEKGGGSKINLKEGQRK